MKFMRKKKNELKGEIVRDSKNNFILILSDENKNSFYLRFEDHFTLSNKLAKDLHDFLKTALGDQDAT